MSMGTLGGARVSVFDIFNQIKTLSPALEHIIVHEKHVTRLRQVLKRVGGYMSYLKFKEFWDSHGNGGGRRS